MSDSLWSSAEVNTSYSLCDYKVGIKKSSGSIENQISSAKAFSHQFIKKINFDKN